MNIDFSDSEKKFQQEVRDFLAEEFPVGIGNKVKNGIHLAKHDYVIWQKILYKRGWAGENWPLEFGGTGWTPTQKYIYNKECALVGAPQVVAFGLKMVAPIIYSYGSVEQKERFLPDILASNVWWCQGYSEPGAGSDLASLKMTAIRDGDNYILNGTKTWTTLAQWADWIFCLVRTDSKVSRRQEGISFMLIDMKTPGITLSPIITIDGEHEINEVHFDNVIVPPENLIGEEGMGWTYAKVLLTHERTGIAQVQQSKVRLTGLKALAKDVSQGNGNAVINDLLFRRKLALIELDLMALEYTELRTLSAISTGTAPGPESSILKIRGTEIMQQIDELYVQLAGYHALPFVQEQYHQTNLDSPVGDWFAISTAPHYFNNRKLSIYGGTNEIQKNIIAKNVLGL